MNLHDRPSTRVLAVGFRSVVVAISVAVAATSACCGDPQRALDVDLLREVGAGARLYLDTSGQDQCPTLRDLVAGDFLADDRVLAHESEIQIRCELDRVVVRSSSGLESVLDR
jgi:hypothetical protein